MVRAGLRQEPGEQPRADGRLSDKLDLGALHQCVPGRSAHGRCPRRRLVLTIPTLRKSAGSPGALFFSACHGPPKWHAGWRVQFSNPVTPANPTANPAPTRAPIQTISPVPPTV